MHGDRASSDGVGLRRAACALGAAVCLVLSGCTTSGSDEPDAAEELLFSPDPTETAAAEPTPTPDPTPTLPALQNDCEGVVRTSDVVAVVGTPLPGETTFLFADALPDIGRTGRVTCGYGDEGEGPAVEITVNDYESADAAGDRVDVTLDAAAERGRTITDQPVGPYDGFVSAGEDATSIIVDAGTRTVVITIGGGLVTEAAEPVVLERLASLALGLPTETLEP